jgi:hypothetical protein
MDSYFDLSFPYACCFWGFLVRFDGDITSIKRQIRGSFCRVIKTVHKGYPLEMCRWSLVDEDRGKFVVFKTVCLQNVWAIGWSDIHYKTCICTQGASTLGEAADKKRRRADGRNYTIQVPRSRVIEDNQKNMGYIDRHNRYRQNIVGLAKLWRTKKWQVRVILEVFEMALVDSFLLVRKFIPRWQTADTSNGVFWRYVPFAPSGSRGPFCPKWLKRTWVIDLLFHSSNVSKF